EAQDKLLAVTTLSFDIAVLELFLPLTVGAQVIIVNHDTAQDGRLLGEALTTRQATVMQATPATWRLLLESGWPGDSGLKALCGGEALPRQLANQLLDKVDDLWNMYGPTETTIWSALHRVTSGQDAVPIGRPIANTRIYVLDSRLQPAPIGVPGDLYISGVGLARGYHHRPDLTQAKFIDNPFEPGTKLYHTGDLARWLPSGELEFLGRIDHQVKVRGFRIELGEIETVLSRYPQVENCVVLAREHGPGDKRLVAYLVVEPTEPQIEAVEGNALPVTQLRQYLKQQLPDYMIPSAFVLLDAFPLTPNGKIDRMALPAPEWRAGPTYVPPQTTTQTSLAGIWAEVLGIESVGIHDDFFDVGGHSLLATQVISRIRTTCQVELPLGLIFEYPTVAELAAQVDQAQPTRLPPIEPVAWSERLSLSFAQQRLWFLEQFGVDSAYNISAALKLRGPLNIAALKQALQTIVDRHEVLRTTFAMVAGQAEQSIAAQATIELPVVEVRADSIPGLARQEMLTPFDLSQDLMLRVKLLRLSAQEHVMLVTLHHIACDGWSIGVLIRELTRLYQAFDQNQPSPLPALPIQYADFGHWQRRWLQDDVLSRQLSYWQQQLAGAPQSSTLPTDRPRPAIQTFRGRALPVTLSAELTEQLRRLSHQTGTTLFMTLLAAFKVLMYRYSGQTDVVVGSAIANRNRHEIEALIGFFVNTLVLRTDLSGDPSFSELLERVKGVTQAAYEHQDLPFEHLVEVVQPDRLLSHTPLVQVNFILQNAPLPPLALPDLEVSPLVVEVERTRFDLDMHLWEVGDTLQGTLMYNTDLFEAATMNRFIGHFQQVLTGIVTDPERSIADLPLLTATEREQLLVAWNETEVSYPHDQCLHQLFEAQVERTPDAVAVVFEDKQMSYGELNQQANQLARHLRSLGVGPDGLVGICVERSLEMMVGLLGILKAGGTYIPLDPAFPAQRLAYILQDAGITTLITQQVLIDQLPEHAAQTVYLDTAGPAIAAQATDNVAVAVGSEQLAYIIYTSGSTGRPKGVQISHRAVVNFLTAMQQQPGIESQDKLLAVTTLSFDIAVLELFLPLTIGAQVILVARETAGDGHRLGQVLAARQATMMQATPATWQLLLTSGWSGARGLKALCGGEALPRHLADQLLGKVGELWNMYGPTETTIWSTLYRVAANDDAVPIGRPIANTRIYILDSQLQPVPIGVAGGLYIGGAGLARGYHHRPELTEEKFIDNPFQPGTELYGTGDVARWLPDGHLEYLGRRDHQVKVRGYRIELGEIEQTLLQAEAIRAAVVLAKSDKYGDKYLCAYYTAPQVKSRAELRTLLAQTLPEYMLPAHFVRVEAMPLTPNGKIDRQALAEQTEQPSHPPAPALPKTELEQQMATIWQEVLELAVVEPDDKFFEIGGTSLNSIRLVEQIEKKLGLKLEVIAIFKYPTVRALSAYVASLQQSDPLSSRSSSMQAIPEPRLVKQAQDWPAYYEDSIALIGMSCQFPDADNQWAFWDNLTQGRASVDFIADEALAALNLPNALVQHPGYKRYQAGLEDKDRFDAAFFQIAPRQAELLDPQVRLLLQHGWAAIEDGGYTPAQIPDTGVFMTATENGYQALLPFEAAATEGLPVTELYPAWLLGQPGTLPTLIAYKLGLKGPAYFVHSNCSSGLTALHAAYQNLLSGECQQALVGASAMTLMPGYFYQEGLNFSSDGRCKTFDADADGFVPGEGVAVLLLKRLPEAIRAGDHIYALLRGMSINNDGADKAGFYAPSIQGQQAVVTKSLESSGVDPATIEYLEAHGTGTRLGDPIELAALTEAYRAYTTKRQYCGIGSVKTNIGHLDTAAGLAGLIKAALAVYHGQMPPSLNYSHPNPQIDFANSPFYVVTEPTPWVGQEYPRRAAVSSLGIGGTNVHAILEEYEEAGGGQAEREDGQPYLVVLSAKNEERLRAYAEKMVAFLSNGPATEQSLSLAGLAYTLQVGRVAMDSRLALVVTGIEAL
ncbi:MAG: amino acid adenylation domain-containing protein, partial [Anaerolineae bacterium]|nr:amino acid adenylation domain-containing protein [Anaerolineae bacterium]